MKAHASPRIRRIATGFLLLACAAQVHALGRRENPAVTPLRNLTIKADPASPQKVEYSIGAAAGLGFMIFTVGWKPTTIQWVVAQDEGGIIGSPVGAGVLDALGADVSEYVLHPGSAVPPIGDATVAFGRIRDFPGDPLHRATGVSCRIPIGLDGAERHIRVLLVHQDGSWERIRFMASFEFFPGEAQLFGTRGDLPYHKKALAFLDTFFSDGTNEQTAFRNTAVLRLSGRYPDLKGDDAFWNAFRDMPGLDERRNMFRSVFLRHMEPVKGGLTDGSGGTSLSRPAWDSLRWDMLYGGEGSPYVTAYLGFLAEIGKPLFSKVLDSELRRVHTGHAYDWRQYQPLGVEEGPELARVALRYLHWGVEYTLASGRGGSEAVYKENREPFIDNWVLGGILANTRMSNYLPSGTAPVAVKPDAGDAGMLEQAVVAKDPLMLSSPFAGGKGNPIPYAEAGIDSPRTFAYKMAEQVKAREWYRLNARIADRTPESSMTTAAPEGFPGDEYVDERRLLVRLGRSVSMDREGWSYAAYQPRPLPVAGNGAILGPYGSATDVLKPFLPGTGAMGSKRFTANDAPGPYNTDKTAGTDCMGLLSGSIAMTSFYSAVLDTGNGTPARNLDRYFAMQPGSPGLDEGGFPSFYADPWPDASSTRGVYRLCRDDLERGTILLPDISSIRAGDLLVCDDERDGVQVGIVVGFLSADRPSLGQDGSGFMKQVIVLSTNREQGHAFLSTWDGGLFTTRPKEFQVRRLLKLSGSAAVHYGADSWELVDNSYSGLQVDLTFQGETDQAAGDQWIANTGETLVIDKIGLKRMNAWGIAEMIDTTTKPMVAVLGPKDYAFRMEEGADRSNLFTNKGGDIGFWALPAGRVTGKPPVLIATFHRDEGAEEYRSTPNPDLFKPDWQWKNGVELTVDADCLVFSCSGFSRTTMFGLKAADMQTARPGDDILLRFGLVEKRGADGPFETTIVGTVGAADFAAVYDLPMLWRANLYVDEGPNDWNNRHPWDDPTNNEWFVSKTSGADKDGGQISISSWTQPYLPYNPADIKYRNVSEAVPYTFGGVDSLPQFNSEMNEQRTAMVAASQLSNNNPYIGWNKTLAPKNKWGNYLDSSYRPCLTYLIEATNTYTGCTMAAGVDCGGFITRIASYRDTPHLIAKSRGVTLTEARHDSFVKNADGSFTCNTAARDCYPPIFENNSDLTNILPYVYQISVSNPSAPGQYDFSRLIPGDIVFMNFHIMMVSSIQRRDTGQLKPEDIFFIEATTWNEMYNVQKSQTMDFYLNQFDNNLANYIFGRLK